MWNLRTGSSQIASHCQPTASHVILLQEDNRLLVRDASENQDL